MLANLGFDITITGKVEEINTEGTLYRVSFNDQSQWLKAREGITLAVGNIVLIKCINGNLSEKYIDCKKP